jgi:hypothetical protein
MAARLKDNKIPAFAAAAKKDARSVALAGGAVTAAEERAPGQGEPNTARKSLRGRMNAPGRQRRPSRNTGEINVGGVLSPESDLNIPFNRKAPEDATRKPRGSGGLP